MADMMDSMEKWVVVKECPIAGGTLPVNSEIQIVHGCVYFNGGLMDSFYQNEFLKLLVVERKKPNYLRKLRNVYNQL
jgi:hypothetical protein